VAENRGSETQGIRKKAYDKNASEETVAPVRFRYSSNVTWAQPLEKSLICLAPNR
jgi:hypothetical protein